MWVDDEVCPGRWAGLPEARPPVVLTALTEHPAISFVQPRTYFRLNPLSSTKNAGFGTRNEVCAPGNKGDFTSPDQSRENAARSVRLTMPITNLTAYSSRPRVGYPPLHVGVTLIPLRNIEVQL